MKTCLRFGAALILATSASAALAQAEPRLVTANKKVIVENVTTVAVGTWTPAVPVTAVSRASASYATPEKAAVALLSAMAAGDYAWWLSIWSPEARALMTQRYQESGRTSADIVANWRGILTERPAVLVGKAEYARQRSIYALVRYRTTGGSGLTARDLKTGKVTDLGSKDFENTLAFKLSNGRWEAVQDLAADPVFHGSGMLWDETKSEVRITRTAD